MAANCKIYTPQKYVDVILDSVGYTKGLKGKKVLENSCGDGNILEQVVKRYIDDSLIAGKDLVEIKKGLENDITGLDTDKGACEKCKKRLQLVAESYGIFGVRFNIVNEDALAIDRKGYTYVLGNPPYITYHDLSEEERVFLREKYSVCKKGRFDYYYAFVEQSLKSLKYGGKISYLIPNSVLKNVWGEELRNYMRPYIRKIIDLKNLNIFGDVTISPIIITMEKRKRDSKVQYICPEEQVQITCEREQLESKWFFGAGTQLQESMRFGDFFKVSNSVATLFNDAFLLTNFERVDENFVRVGDLFLESELLYPAVSPRSMRQGKNYLIIFPYYREEYEVYHFNDEIFEERFPGISAYLRQFSDQLNNRASDKKAKWFEYGRNQAIRHIHYPKLIMPMVVTKSNRVYEAQADAIPFAGYYVRQLDGYSLLIAKKILESSEFLKYVEQRGIPTSKNSYRISAKEINEYYFDGNILNGEKQ